MYIKWSNGFIVWTLFRSAWSLRIWCGLKLFDTSFFLVRPRSSKTLLIVVVHRKWDSAHLCRAEIELVNAETPALWQAASAFTVCSSARYIGFLEKDFGVCLIINIVQGAFLEVLTGYHGTLLSTRHSLVDWMQRNS